jgi:HlyD family secretion protein
MTASLSSGAASAPVVVKPRKKSKLVWYLLGGSVLLAALIAAAVAKKRSTAATIAVTTELAVTKTIVQVVTATGKIQPEVEVKITPEVFGEIVAALPRGRRGQEGRPHRQD